MALVLFDLDGTLLTGDTDELWCEFLMAEGVLERASFGARNRAVAEGYAAGSIAPAQFCAFYASTLAGRTAVDWAPLRDRFVRTVVVPRLGNEARALVESHRHEGDRLVLTTATHRFLAEPIAAELGIAELIATELESEAGIFTGRNTGTLNMREGKVARLRAWLATQGLPEHDLTEATFYSDSRNDLPLLHAVGCAIAVDADDHLQAEALRHGWRVLRLAR